MEMFIGVLVKLGEWLEVIVFSSVLTLALGAAMALI
jgi:hypothetical protein